MDDVESTRPRQARAWVIPAVAVVAATFTLTGAGQATAAAIADMIVGVQDLPGDADGTKIPFQSHDDLVVFSDDASSTIVLEAPSPGELTVELISFRAILPTGEVPVVTVRTHGVATHGRFEIDSNDGGTIPVALESVGTFNAGQGAPAMNVWIGTLAGRFHSRDKVTVTVHTFGHKSVAYSLEASAAGYQVVRATRTE